MTSRDMIARLAAFRHVRSLRPSVLVLSRNVASMPPKRATTKRKAESDDSEAEEVKASTSKKAKTTKAEERPGNGQPTNKVLPVNIVFPKKHEGCMRIAAWNVCGLATSQKKVRARSDGVWAL